MNFLYIFASFFQISSNWNLLLLLIGGCSVLSFTVFIERFYFLKKSEIDTNAFLLTVRSHVKEGNIIEAIKTCEQLKGAVSNIVKAGLMKHHLSEKRIENAMELAGLLEIARLEKNAKILSVIAYIAPLIGLLGTVTGFIQAFSEMRMSGLVDISATKLGEAMEYALVTTAAGLAVAIPSIIAYNYIACRVEGFVLDIQTTASEVVDLLVHREEHEI